MTNFTALLIGKKNNNEERFEIQSKLLFRMTIQGSVGFLKRVLS